MSLLENLIEQIKKIEVENIDFNKLSNPERVEIKTIDKGSSYIWIRVYLKENFDKKSNIGDDFKIIWNLSGEELECKFITFGKKGRNSDWEDIVNYEKEFDESVMIMMVDEDFIKRGDNIPFIRSLFPNYKWYEESVFRTDELKFYNKTSDFFLDYTFVQF